MSRYKNYSFQTNVFVQRVNVLYGLVSLMHHEQFTVQLSLQKLTRHAEVFIQSSC